MKSSEVIAIGAGVALGVVALVAIKKAQATTVQGAASAIVTTAADAAAGLVIGAGQVVGIPQTNADRGRAEFAAGNYWEASFLMPAGDFITASWNKFFNQ